METQKIKWSCSLSNGETLYEGKGDYQIIAGELSPWQRLLNHLEKTEAKITSLSLYSDDRRRWNLPSAGKNPKFKELADIEKPTGYRFFRKAGIDMDFDGGNRFTEIYSVIEAICKNERLQLWVAEEYPNPCWSIIL